MFYLVQAWKRWCTQILSALRLSPLCTRLVTSYHQDGVPACSIVQFKLITTNHNLCLIDEWYVFSYLHSCTPPIVHGNLTTDTIFIQSNGLIKIGSGKSPHLAYMTKQLIKEYLWFISWTVSSLQRTHIRHCAHGPCVFKRKYGQSVSCNSVRMCVVYCYLCFMIAVAPDAIYNHVKTYKQEQRNMHYIAPEYAGKYVTAETLSIVCSCFGEIHITTCTCTQKRFAVDGKVCNNRSL